MRLNTYYDKELNSQAYMIKSSEGYSRSTDTILTVDEIDTSNVLSFQANLTVDVMRDVRSEIDDGLIEIYDNGDLIHSIVWNDDTVRTFPLKFSYDTEHNVIAKFTGNRRCKPSNSLIWSHTVPRPLIHQSIIEITSPLNYNSNRPTLTGVLKDGEGNGISNVKLKVYENDVLLGETTVTNNNGEFSFDKSSDYTWGKHTLKFVFDGTDTNSSEELFVTISLGYNISILDYDDVWANGCGSLTANVSDWNGAVLTNAYCELKTGGNGFILSSGYTDNNGNITFVVDTAPSVFDGTMYVLCGSVDSEQVSVVNVDVTELNISSNESIGAIGVTSDINVSITSDPVVDGVKVKMNNANPSELELINNQGVATYECTGAGDTQISASVGGLTQTIDYTDAVMYWTPSKLYNYSYVPIKGAMSYYARGFQLETGKGKYTAVIGFGNIYSNYDFDYEITFKVVAYGKLTQFYFGKYDENKNIDGAYYIFNSLKKNDEIKITKKGNTMGLYHNGNYKKTYNSSDEIKAPALGIVCKSTSTESGYLLFNNLMFRKVITND